MQNPALNYLIAIFFLITYSTAAFPKTDANTLAELVFTFWILFLKEVSTIVSA